jgi:4-hydroxy-tetrahydrodipicolinate synthase
LKKPLFEGVGVAVITPFTESGINYEKLEQLIEFQIINGVEALIACGTTGEASTMSDKERISVIKHFVDVTNKRVPIIAGTGSNDTLHATELAQAAEQVGADALMQVSPYYNKTNQKGLIQHFGYIARKVKTPIILYNIPVRVNYNILPSTMAELSKIDNIIGVKECNLDQVGDVVNACGPDFAVYFGDDNAVLPALSLGAKGSISVMGNIIPKDTKDMVTKFLCGDITGARKIQLKALPLIRALYADINPMPLKAAMNLLGMDVGKCRMPLSEIDEKTLEQLKKAMADYGLVDKIVLDNSRNEL